MQLIVWLALLGVSVLATGTAYALTCSSPNLPSDRLGYDRQGNTMGFCHGGTWQALQKAQDAKADHDQQAADIKALTVKLEALRAAFESYKAAHP